MIFDVSDYTLPTFDSIDWQKTKEQVGIFLRAYKVNRERMGLPVYPKLTSECFLVFREDLIKEKWKAGQELTRNEEEYLKTEQCFVYAFSAIMHPYRSEMTERRRRVFFIVIYMVYLFHWLASELVIKKILLSMTQKWR